MIIGHQRQLQLLDLHVRTGTLSHAYLFTGPRHVGKMTVARRVAASLLCGKMQIAGSALFACGACEVCRSFASGVHPDVFIIDTAGTGEKAVYLEDIQRLRARACQSAHGGVHVFFIRNAAVMTREAANAFLKVLEEPRAQAVFFLIAENADDVLSTIRSRSWQVRFWPVSEEVLLAGLQERGISAKKAEEISRMSAGLVGKAVVWSEMAGSAFQEAKTAHERAVSLLYAPLLERMQYAEKMKDDAQAMNAWYTESMVVIARAVHASLQQGGSAQAVAAADKCRELLERHARFMKPYAVKNLFFEDSVFTTSLHGI